MVQIIARHHIAVKSYYLQAGYLIDVDCKRLIYLTLHVFFTKLVDGKRRSARCFGGLRYPPQPSSGGWLTTNDQSLLVTRLSDETSIS